MFSEPDGRVERDEGDEREERESRERKRGWSEDEKRGRKKAMGSGFMNKGTDEGASRTWPVLLPGWPVPGGQRASL